MRLQPHNSTSWVPVDTFQVASSPGQLGLGAREVLGTSPQAGLPLASAEWQSSQTVLRPLGAPSTITFGAPPQTFALGRPDGGPNLPPRQVDQPTRSVIEFGRAKDPFLQLDLHPPAMVNLGTAICALGEYDLFWEWPEEECAPPLASGGRICELPPTSDIEAAASQVPFVDRQDELVTLPRVLFLRMLDPEDCSGATSTAGPTQVDLDLTYAAIAILRKDQDMVRWAACLTESWSPEVPDEEAGVGMLPECVDDLLTGATPWEVTFVARSIQTDSSDVCGFGGATMWAYTRVRPSIDGTLAVIIASEHPAWLSAVRSFEAGGSEAFCAAVSVASQILHELVHVCAAVDTSLFPGTNVSSRPKYPLIDHRGAVHDLTWCWDEPGMVDSIFVWAMSQRYSCLADEPCCARMGDDLFFATSLEHFSQLWSC